MAVKESDPTTELFDHHAGDHDGPTDDALNLAGKLRERDEIRRLTWMSYTETIKVKTEDVESTLNALDLDRLTVEVTDTSVLDTSLVIDW